RSSEMRPGAKLLAAFTCRTPHETGWEWLLGELWSALCDMAREGHLTDKEKKRLTIPIGLRTIDEIKAPFVGNGRFAELLIEKVEILRVSDPYWNDFQLTGDREMFGSRHADTTKAWCGPTIARLIDPSRDQTAFLHDVFVRFAQRLSADPKKHEPYVAVVGLEKQFPD
ncbi:MAG: SAM-dependent methyltransferase, partial [Methylobacteriaceae bacterium]|nr:SAM-dependent methyltransferase [Methylobacteriaceae bacterium]